MRFNIIALCTLLLFTFSSSIAAQECDKVCQLNEVKAYFSALDIVARKGSTAEDIDALLALMHQNVKYVHVEYEANFDKETWRKAFLRNLKLGRYQNTKNNEIRILKHISGKNHLAVEYSHGTVQQNGQWQATEPLLVIFAFTKAKISLVKELW